jgi:N-acetyl-gamma-glutamyl-phosphate reductase
MVKAVVIGASGYAGAEVLRYLGGHPEVEVAAAVAHSHVGSALADVHPWLRRAYPSLRFVDISEACVDTADLVFTALPHGQSAAMVSALPSTTKVVDLGADFRLNSPAQWQKYYGGAHAGTWTYGLADVPEFADAVAQATRVANPGCYATALALSMMPAAAHGLAQLGDVVAVAASGTSGAGRSADAALSATEVIGSMRAYKAGGVHQHTPEVEQTLETVAGAPVSLSFTPVLAPMTRGIHATVTAPLIASKSQVLDAYSQVYANSPFVTVLPAGEEGRTSDVCGTNEALLSVHCDEHSGRLVITCVIDNLGKGAAGQAVQNANLMLGLAPDAGLRAGLFGSVVNA